MTFPVISNTINTSTGTITTTSTTVETHVQPPSDIVLALTLDTPLACDSVYLCLIKVDGDSVNDDSLCIIEVDDDSSDDDSVDQQTMKPLFHQVSRYTAYK